MNDGLRAYVQHLPTCQKVRGTLKHVYAEPHHEHTGREVCTCGLESLLASLQESSGLRPIETAPKDGTSVVLWDERQHVAFIGRFSRVVGSTLGRWQSSGHTVHPTHWMPLPASPSTSTEPAK